MRPCASARARRSRRGASRRSGIRATDAQAGVFPTPGRRQASWRPPSHGTILMVVSISIARTVAPRWGRDLVFQLAGLLTGVIAAVLWNVGVIVSITLAITYVGLVVTLWSLLAMRWLARVERRRAAIVLGEPIAERYRPAPDRDRRWTARLHDLMGEPATWRDFAWSALWGMIGPAVASVAIGLWIGVLGLVTLPAWYWALPDGADFGIVSVDSMRARACGQPPPGSRSFRSAACSCAASRAPSSR